MDLDLSSKSATSHVAAASCASAANADAPSHGMEADGSSSKHQEGSRYRFQPVPAYSASPGSRMRICKGFEIDLFQVLLITGARILFRPP